MSKSVTLFYNFKTFSADSETIILHNSTEKHNLLVEKEKKNLQ